MPSIRYLVSNVDESIKFYTELLGFKLEQKFGTAMAIVVQDGLTLWLAGPTSSAAQPMTNGDKPQPGGWNRFVHQTKDLSSLVAKLRASGVKFRNEVVKGPGGQQIICEDPSGNIIEIFQPA